MKAMKLKLKYPFGTARTRVPIVDVGTGEVIGEARRNYGSWGTPTTYQVIMNDSPEKYFMSTLLRVALAQLQVAREDAVKVRELRSASDDALLSDIRKTLAITPPHLT